MDQQTQRQRQIFDAVADTYDQVGVDFFGPIAEGLVRRLDFRPGDDVLDLGCGGGAVLLRAARAVEPGGRAVGGDVSPLMVDRARELAQAERLSNVEVRELDAQEPELTSGSFDVLSASLVLFFLPDPTKALCRWKELLRPGGRLGISTFGPIQEEWRSIDRLFVPYLPPQMRDARTTGAAGPFASDAGVEAMLRAAGLEDVRTETVDLQVRFESPDHWYRFSMSIGQRGFWMMVPEPERPALQRAASLIVEANAAADGSTTFQQTIRYTLGRRPQAVDAAN